MTESAMIPFLNTTINSTMDDVTDNEDADADAAAYHALRMAGLMNFRCQVFSQFVIHTLVFGTLGCLGLVGNVVSMMVLARDRQSRVASLLLQAIAVVDNVLLLLWLIRFAATGALMHTKYYFKFKYGWQVSDTEDSSSQHK